MAHGAVTTRSHALAVICPVCGADADAPCMGDSSSTPRSAHLQRHGLAIDLGAPSIEQDPTGRDAREPRVQLTTTREAALAVDCPRCGAVAQKPCLGTLRRTARLCMHIQRHHRAIELGARQIDSRSLARMTSRAEAQEVDCPTCGVAVGEPCRGSDGMPRRAVHRTRQLAVLAVDQDL
ncbi:zinc finger domain-containing protein [Solirubrobacter ginsenosidimutans]|uniref:zinc finger domain-containing protein n=1 Tax=Solirubrobacter ginsenosidimutans TaxID=490573 RepID=UPI003FD7D68A